MRRVVKGVVGVALVLTAFAPGQVRCGTERAWVRIYPADSTLAEVLVDSQQVKVDSAGFFAVTSGRHRFTVVRRLNIWPPLHVWRVDTTAVRGDTLELRLPAVVVVRSRPPDAQVWLGNRLLGRTPFWLVVTPRMWGQELRVVKPGYKGATVTLKPETQGVLTVPLVLLHPPSPVAQSGKRVRTLKRGALISASLTLLAGVAAVQLRNEANATYGEYLHAGSLREMNRLYDRTRRLDRYSAGAYGVFEVGFVVSFYLFLRWQAAVQE